MTKQEYIQRQVEAMYGERERRDYEREHGLSPWMHVEADRNHIRTKADPTNRPDHDALLRIALQNRYNERHGL